MKLNQSKFRYKISATKDILEKYYFNDDSTWIVSYSGGKDSTLVLQMLFEILKKRPRDCYKKDIYVISSDTLVENPLIIARLLQNLMKIEQTANSLKIPLKTVLVAPDLYDSYWAKIIGLGYPPPNIFFRWCTDKLKANPIKKAIKNILNEHQRALIILGSRSDESQQRERTLARLSTKKEKIRRWRLPNTFAFAPIEDWTTEEVWEYLLDNKSPWGSDNMELYSLYAKSANSNECPFLADENSPPCGSSRFGCWTCTVVKDDRSMLGLINSGEKNLERLYEFRVYLKRFIQDEYRENIKRNNKPGPGPITKEYRIEILEKLLNLCRELNRSLISPEEVELINRIWVSEGFPVNYAQRIYNKVFLGEPMKILKEEELLEEKCLEKGISPELIFKLLDIEKEKGYLGKKKRINVLERIKEVLDAYKTANDLQL